MISRKDLLKKSACCIACSSWIGQMRSPFISTSKNLSITILYTNDTHARIDPIPKNAREFAGLGGIAKRSSLVNKIRSEEEHVLLFDAGDVFMGSPWFNVFGGTVDFKLMSEIGYDAMAIGNHEFDIGLDGFAEAARYAHFPFLCSNYYTRNTPMHPFLERELIKEIEGYTIGIFGLGIQLEGIVDPKLYGKVRHRDPILSARRSVDNFRNFHQCDFIICLSHLGFRYGGNQIDDITLAEKVPGIDLIIGGHTHTFLEKPVEVEGPGGSTTFITQMGHSGVYLGRIDLQVLESSIQPKIVSKYYTIGKI